MRRVQRSQSIKHLSGSDSHKKRDDTRTLFSRRKSKVAIQGEFR